MKVEYLINSEAAKLQKWGIVTTRGIILAAQVPEQANKGIKRAGKKMKWWASYGPPMASP
jgi:hypothetical protein